MQKNFEDERSKLLMENDERLKNMQFEHNIRINELRKENELLLQRNNEFFEKLRFKDDSER